MTISDNERIRVQPKQNSEQTSVVRRTDAPPLLARAVREAVELLQAGAVVALPTETVYGLAANAFNAAAVEQIFRIKGRPEHNPLIVHVASIEMAQACIAAWPTLAARLADAFWPGPLTLVLPKSSRIPQIVTAGGSTVGIRWPSHPVIQAVIRACGFPLAAPSANRSGQISPTTADHVARSLGHQVPLILDGGAAELGIESTVLDLTLSPAQVLRPGTIHAESLAAVAGALLSNRASPAGVWRSPGMMTKHYAPKAKVVIWHEHGDEALKRLLQETNVNRDHVHILTRTRLQIGFKGHISVMPRDPGPFGKALYAELHRCDAAGADLIIVEAVPESIEWQAIADRLTRAAA